MKDYEVLKENGNVKLEQSPDGVRVRRADFNPATGEKTFTEAMVTNERHQSDIIRDLKAQQKQTGKMHREITADLKAKIEGAKALRTDLKQLAGEK